MDTLKNLQKEYPGCEIVEKPRLFSHMTDEDMGFYCNGVHAGTRPTATLRKGTKVSIHSNSDPLRPWVVIAYGEHGVVGQVEGKLRHIPL